MMMLLFILILAIIVIFFVPVGGKPEATRPRSSVHPPAVPELTGTAFNFVLQPFIQCVKKKYEPRRCGVVGACFAQPLS